MISDTLQQPYDRSRWTTLIHEVFPNVTIYEKPESSSEKPEWIKDFFQLGNVRLQDGKNLAIFEIRVDDKVQLSRNRVTLRELISKKIDLGTTHGVLCVFNSSSPEYRFTFVAKEVGFDEEGAITTTETNSKRYTYVLGPGETRRTASQRFSELAAHREEAGVKEVIEAFSVERLNKEFFRTYKDHYQAFVNHLINQTDCPRTVFGITETSTNSNYDSACKPIRDWVKQLLGRIVFIHFIQKKGWMGCKPGSKGWKDGDPQFIKNFFDSSKDKARFCSQNLAPLFFEALNAPDRPGDIFELTGNKIPYLNGGLFDEPDEKTRKIDFPENLFQSLLDFLAAYNFTIDENDPEEHEVGIDPEMLGHIFENLLEENKDKGAYYTPKPVVQFMCQQSLLLYLQTHLGEQPGLDTLVRQKDPGENTKENWIRQNAARIEELLDKVTICDPAIGSGAFPMGMLQEIFWIKLSLDWTLNDTKKFAAIKRQIIENTIHGVDLDPGAVEIAKLRCWLAIVVDDIEPRPLPNLDFKIHCANSLVEYLRGEPVSFLSQEALGLHSEKYIKSLGAAKIALFESVKKQEKRSAKLDVYRSLIELGKIEFTWLKTHEGFTSNDKRIFELNSVIEELNSFSNELAAVDKLAPKYQDFLLNKLQAWFEYTKKPTFGWRLHFAEVFSKGGFDIVIANPPYVRQETFTQTKALLKKLYTTYKGTADLYTYFYERSLNLLNKRGILVFITSDKFHRADFGEKLRAFIADKLNIKILIDFRDIPIFNALAYASILIGQVKHNCSNMVAVARWCSSLEIEKINSRNLNIYFPRKISYFDSKKWTIETEQEFSVFQKIELLGVKIKDFYKTKLYYGLKTALNKAFVIDESQAKAMIDEDPNAHQYLTPIIQGKTDLNSWSSRNNLSFLVKVESSENFNHPWSGKSEIEALRIFKETTPSVSSWLLRFEENLKNRSDQGAFFWELRSCTYWSEFAKDKVIIPTLSKEPVAVLDKNGFACNDKTTICVCNKPLLLAALMHCDLIWWQLTRIAAIRQNGYFEIKDMYLSDLFLPILTKDDADFFEMHGSECINKEKKGVDVSQHKTAINKKLSEIWHISDDQLLVVSNALRGKFLKLI